MSTYFDFIVALNTIALFIVTVACAIHVVFGMDRRTKLCERIGYVFTSGGAAGVAAYPWWPRIESFPFATLLYIGAMFIALSLVQGDFRGWIRGERKTIFTGIERRKVIKQ